MNKTYLHIANANMRLLYFASITPLTPINNSSVNILSALFDVAWTSFYVQFVRLFLFLTRSASLYKLYALVAFALRLGTPSIYRTLGKRLKSEKFRKKTYGPTPLGA